MPGRLRSSKVLINDEHTFIRAYRGLQKPNLNSASTEEQRRRAMGFAGAKREDGTGGESRSLGDKPFGSSRNDEQRQQVRDHARRHLGERVDLRNVTQERDVQGNVAQVEIQEPLDQPSPVEAAHTRQRRPFPLRSLAQRLRATLGSTRRVGFQALPSHCVPYNDDRFFVAASSYSGWFASSTLAANLAV